MALDTRSLTGRSVGTLARQVKALFDAKFPNADADVNYLSLGGAAASAEPALAALGADADIDVKLVPKGAGVVSFGVLTANADAPATGYITIKDAAGTPRKLMVMA